MPFHGAELAAEGRAGRRRFPCRVRRSGVRGRVSRHVRKRPPHCGVGSKAHEQLVPRRWFIPSNIGVPAFGGASLFGKFTQVRATGHDIPRRGVLECLVAVHTALHPSEQRMCATQSIGANLARFPTGPALNDPFWCVTEKMLSATHGASSDTNPQRMARSVKIRVVLRRLYLITWHVGLFVVLTLGQIGVQVRILPQLDLLLRS